MVALTFVLGTLLAAAFAVSGVRKIVATDRVHAEADHLAVPRPAFRAIGVAEVVGAVGVVVGFASSVIGIVAGAALAVLMLGAVSMHRRVHDPVTRLLPAAVLGLLAVAVVVVHVVST